MDATLTESRPCPQARPDGPVAQGSPVAILLSRFPLVTETFILREIIELERQGQPVRLVPLLREEAEVVHPEAREWVERALFTPYLSHQIIAANARAFRRDPGRYLGLLRRLIGGTVTSANFLLRTLALFPKAVYLAERLRKERVGHLHAHFATHPTTVAMIISELSGIPFSFTVHAHDIFVRRQLLPRKLERASWVRLISEFNRQYLLARYPEVDSSKLVVIHTGIDPEIYRPGSETGDRVRPADREGSRPLDILCIAALKGYKGLGVLIDACRELDFRGYDFNCRIVGEGPLRRQLEARIEDDGLHSRVELLGALPQGEVAQLLARADVVVQPSVVAADGQMEGIPVALMEAMAAGKPVIASRLSGIPELVIDGETGILVEPGNAHELVAAITSLVRDTARTRNLAHNGLRRVGQHFDLQRNVALLRDELSHRVVNPLGEITAALSAMSCSTAGGPAHPRLVWVDRRVDATTAGLEWERDAHSPRMVLKIHHELSGARRSAAERAQHEWRVLRRLGDSLQGIQGPDTEEFGFPRRAELAEGEPALLMEWVEGVPLTDLIRRARFSSTRDTLQEAVMAVEGAGSWLRIFQGRLATEGGVATARERLISESKRHLQAIEHLEPARRDAVVENLESLLARAPVDRHWLRLQHGDFWPGNILRQRERTNVIDFEGVYNGLAYEDVAYFVEHLELFFRFPLPLMEARRRRLREAFLQRYLEQESLEEALWEACRMAAIIRILRFGHGFSDSWSGRHARRYLLTRLKDFE